MTAGLMWQPLMSPNALANTMMVSPCASAIPGICPPPSTVPAPAPTKIKAKVPMNSAASGFVNPFIAPVLHFGSRPGG